MTSQNSRPIAGPLHCNIRSYFVTGTAPRIFILDYNTLTNNYQFETSFLYLIVYPTTINPFKEAKLQEWARNLTVITMKSTIVNNPPTPDGNFIQNTKAQLTKLIGLIETFRSNLRRMFSIRAQIQARPEQPRNMFGESGIPNGQLMTILQINDQITAQQLLEKFEDYNKGIQPAVLNIGILGSFPSYESGWTVDKLKTFEQLNNTEGYRFKIVDQNHGVNAGEFYHLIVANEKRYPGILAPYLVLIPQNQGLASGENLFVIPVAHAELINSKMLMEYVQKAIGYFKTNSLRYLN